MSYLTSGTVTRETQTKKRIIVPTSIHSGQSRLNFDAVRTSTYSGYPVLLARFGHEMSSPKTDCWEGAHWLRVSCLRFYAEQFRQTADLLERAGSDSDVVISAY